MSRTGRLITAAPTRADVAYFLRALLTRPGDLPGILRREAARRRALAAGPKDDPLGIAALVTSWEAAFAAGMFEAAPGPGPALVVREIGARPLDLVTELQWAAAVRWLGVEAAAAFPPLSLEAARLALPQAALDPEAARARRAEWAAAAPVSPALRTRLLALTDAPMGRA